MTHLNLENLSSGQVSAVHQMAHDIVQNGWGGTAGRQLGTASPAITLALWQAMRRHPASTAGQHAAQLEKKLVSGGLPHAVLQGLASKAVGQFNGEGCFGDEGQSAAAARQDRPAAPPLSACRKHQNCTEVRDHRCWRR